jgi:uncharacterized protein Yka (UPF0111/DUF47 family)
MVLPWRSARAKGQTAPHPRRTDLSGGTDLLERFAAQVDELARGVREWRAYLGDGDPVHLDAIDAIEEAGDVARLAVVRAMDEHFVTPIDREDMYALSRAIDAVLDAVESAMLETGQLQEMRRYAAVEAAVDVLERAIADMRDAVAALLTNPDVVRAKAVRIHRAAKRIDRAAREGLHALEEAGPVTIAQARAMIFVREINHYLRAVAERLDALADRLAEIEVKLR